jgi:hypothetical protein
MPPVERRDAPVADERDREQTLAHALRAQHAAGEVRDARAGKRRPNPL